MKDKVLKFISMTVVLLFCVLFLVKFAGAKLLKLYVISGIGDCQSIPILCMAPEDKIINPQIEKLDREFLGELLPHKLPDIEVHAPKGFAVFKEDIKKVYYKKKKRTHQDAILYLMYKRPNYFVDLFPQLKKQNVENDYEFIYRVMSARLEDIKNFTDVFFVIAKGALTPDLGKQEVVKMIKFAIEDKRGVLNYNISEQGNYFDCNIFDKEANYFKIYIRDKNRRLDLKKVFLIISSVKKAD